VKSLRTLPAKIDNRNIDIFMWKYLLAQQTLGSARASRAGEGALAFANFSLLLCRTRELTLAKKSVAARRRDRHAEARALPGES
jgi:hypothetical protein